MRPIKLILSAFGPYAGRTVVEMDKLGTTGLYLITGDTGAGKTTIFDGITYGLYGEASGSSREPAMLRSKYADPATPTEVELTFSYRGKVYVVKRNPEYQRPSKRGDKLTTQKAEAQLTFPDGRVLTRRKEIDIAMNEIMGIDRNQFSQIAMIAQGDFLKLLLAPTEDRKKIFRQIFKTDKFQVLQERFKSESGNLGKQCEAARNSVNQYIQGILCDETDVLAPQVEEAKAGHLTLETTCRIIDQMLFKDKAIEKSLEREIVDIDEQLSLVNAAIGKAEELQKTRKLLTAAEEKKEKTTVILKDLSVILEEEKAKQPEHVILDKEIAALEVALPQYDELDHKKNKLSQLARQLEEDTQLKNQKTAVLEMTISKIHKLKGEQAELQNAGAQKEKLTYERKQAEEKKQAIELLEKSTDEYHNLVKKLKTAQSSYQAAADKAAALKESYDIQNKAYLDGQAGILAETLTEGSPCPVCGSVSHPCIAAKSDKAPEKAQLDQAKKDADQAQNLAEKASRRAGEIKGTTEEKELGLKDQITNLAGDLSIDAACEHFAELKQATEAQMEALHIQITQEQTRMKRKSELDASIPAEEKNVEEMEKEIGSLKEKIASVQMENSQIDRQIQAVSEKLRFNSKNSAEKQKDNLQNKKEKIKRDLEEAQKNHGQCEKVLLELKGKMQQMKEQLLDAPAIDLEQEKTRKEQMVQRKTEINAVNQSVHTRLSTNQSAKENIQAKAADLAALEARWTWVKGLSNTVNGTISGKEKIMLETYIQMHYFDRIIARANTRFMVMSDGQYELKRRRAAENNRSQSGLELDVIDHYNGTDRSVKTLSGGEAFKASLSLALGLSDEIQSSAGGIRLETMFVDEGFGTLDEDSLRQAIKALAGLAEGNRLVGIISHVSELKEKIDKQIIITKEKAGGSRVTLQ